MKKITMGRNTHTSVEEDFSKLIRIKRAKNLSPDSLRHYEEQYVSVK